MMKPKSTKGRLYRAGLHYPEDPRSDDVLVDRELRLLLERNGIDLHHLSDAMFYYGLDYWPGNYPIKMAMQEAHDNLFVLQQIGIGPVIFTTGMAIGKASFTGDRLCLRFLVPETICDGAPGRRLGDLVDTGISSINERQIIYARRIGEGPQSPATFIRFAPALVRLGLRSGLHLPPSQS